MTNSFQLWPAIDILDGRVVRLRQGNYNQTTAYNTSITALVETFNSFATGIHVVDLNGARSGTRVNTKIIQEVAHYATVPIELGGGIRSASDADQVLALGVDRVIFGSAAIHTPEVVQEALAQYGPEKVVLGVDAKNGMVATDGWETTSDKTVTALIDSFLPHGLRTVIHTDIATDGMLQGPNLSALQALQQRFPTLDIIASGGVSNMADIHQIKQSGLSGVIFGKAYYEGLLPVTELQHAL